MNATIIDGKAIAAQMGKAVAVDAAALATEGRQPKLVSVSVGDTAAVELYVRNQQRSAESAGVRLEARNYPQETSLEQLTGILQDLNGDPRVNGIIIQRPLPDHIPLKTLQKTVHPLKDVEGKTVGDADFDSCSPIAGRITPVPGGVGPVTVATVMKNAALATRLQMNHYRDSYVCVENQG